MSAVPACELAGLPLMNFRRHCASALLQEHIARAKQAYAQVAVTGSDHKDNWGSLTYTAAFGVKQGAVFVGVPTQLRLALSYVTVKAPALVSSLLGARVSYV